MVATKSTPFGVCCVLATGLAVAGINNEVSASDDAGQLHKSTAQSDPERSDAADEKRFRIDRSTIASEKWQDAIRRALSHQSGRGHYTLLRVLVDDAVPGETIQAQGTKLKELTERYDGGGGEFRV